MEYTKEEVDIFRQWFDCVQDVNPEFLDRSDYELAKKVYEDVGMRVPGSILEKLQKLVD